MYPPSIPLPPVTRTRILKPPQLPVWTCLTQGYEAGRLDQVPTRALMSPYLRVIEVPELTRTAPQLIHFTAITHIREGRAALCHTCSVAIMVRAPVGPSAVFVLRSN